jgi:hypothetical protein
MALPVQSTPTYSVVVPSSGETVKFRPFLIKEEKALLVAQQSEDTNTMIDTLRGVIDSCTYGKLDTANLALFDLEYLFTQIRGKSVGENVELLFSCDTCVDEKAKVKINLDLSKIEVKKSKDHDKKIQLFGDVGVVMKYPSVEILRKFENIETEDINVIFDIVSSCIDFIYNTDEVFYAKETKKEDVLDFLNNLTQEQFAKIQKFFETMPKLSTNVKYNCPVCGKAHDKEVEGLNNFFS